MPVGGDLSIVIPGLRESGEPGIHQCAGPPLTKKWLCSVYATEPDIKRTDEFSSWLRNLRDIRARAKVLARIARLSLGNPGDVALVGDGISEMRIHYGPGYRVYYVQRGEEIVVLLCGGDKGSQASDIRAAKKLASELED